ncbi:MAG: ATP-dependent Clp protease proteolytic subunit [Candidatus Woesearchaeota archaeon]
MVYDMLKSGLVWGPKDLVEGINSNEPRMSSSNGNVYFYDNSARYSPKSLLFKDRTIILSGMVDGPSSESAMEQLLALDAIAKDEGKDITMYVNSPGGYVSDGLMVYDTMQHIRSEVSTVVTGQAASMASILLVAGAKGKRCALPNSTIMLHEASGGSNGKYSSMKVQFIELDRKLDMLLDIYIKHINRDKDGYFCQFGGKTNMETLDEMEPTRMDDKELKAWLKKWLEKDRYITAEQALNLGIIDSIVDSKKGKPK